MGTAVWLFFFLSFLLPSSLFSTFCSSFCISSLFLCTSFCKLTSICLIYNIANVHVSEKKVFAWPVAYFKLFFLAEHISFYMLLKVKVKYQFLFLLKRERKKMKMVMSQLDSLVLFHCKYMHIVIIVVTKLNNFPFTQAICVSIWPNKRT